MSDLYTLKLSGTKCLSTTDMKSYLKGPPSADDALIASMIEAATTWGEKYTGREFRANTWTLLKDAFETRICLNRDPVNTITSVKHLVSVSLVTVASSVYYLKKNTQFSEILLNENQEWPTDTDDREQVIQIEFVTKSYRCGDAILTAIKRHVAFWYQNRGDCPDSKSAAEGSGVSSIYDQFRIVRV